ncbi:ATPase domain-containing protein [Silvibacterium bohemicum]|jgi:predicted ATP-dependent serine protease|uniref:ATPase domain-containing protein n=1 Tax=Silvibacterium bohemicum TaxID=1577686 RepID=UPI0009E419E2
MSASATIRLQVETALAKRVPAALTLKIKQAPELFSTGIEEADAVLGGGIPRGSITEVAGAASTGKTSFALSSIASITQSGAACAWVDVSDALSPESAAAANIVLKTNRHDAAELLSGSGCRRSRDLLREMLSARRFAQRHSRLPRFIDDVL